MSNCPLNPSNLSLSGPGTGVFEMDHVVLLVEDASSQRVGSGGGGDWIGALPTIRKAARTHKCPHCSPGWPTFDSAIRRQRSWHLTSSSSSAVHNPESVHPNRERQQVILKRHEQLSWDMEYIFSKIFFLFEEGKKRKTSNDFLKVVKTKSIWANRIKYQPVCLVIRRFQMKQWN